MVAQSRESKDDRKSRLLLVRFLELTERLLDRLLQRLVLDFHNLFITAGEYLVRIWNSARKRLASVIEGISHGLNSGVRRSLEQVGMFGRDLEDKFDLLSVDISQGAVKRILKRLNSMLSSLAKVFRSLHAIKEFKDHVEATIEGFKEPPEFISLKDLIEKS